MLSDIEIAQSAKLKRIDDLAHEWGLEDDEFEPYGWDKAKLTLNPERKADAKLILVTATSGMPPVPARPRLRLLLLRLSTASARRQCLRFANPLSARSSA